MNYANLGFAQVDMSGAYVNVVSEQQLIAGTYNKVLDAIKNQKIIVLVNLKSRGEGEAEDALSPAIACATTYVDNDELVVSITCSDITEHDIVIKSDDTMTEE